MGSPRDMARGMGGRAVRSTLWSVVNVIAATGVGIVTARVLGVDLRGTLALMLSVAGLVVLLAALGTNVAVRRRLPQGQTTARQYLRVSAIIFVGLLILAPVTAVALASWVDPAFREFPVAMAFVAYALTFFWSNQLLDLLNAVGKVPLSAATNATGTAVCLVTIAIVASVGGGVALIGLCYAMSMIFQATLAFSICVRVARSDATRVESGWRLIRDGTMMMGLNLGQAITYRADTLIIGALSSPYAVGLYAVATTPAALLRLPATAVGQVLLFDAASGKAGLSLVWKRVLQVELLLLCLAAGGWLLADVAIILLFGEAFADAIDVFRILLIAELALAPFLVLSRVLVGLGGTWHASVAGVVGAVTLIVVAIVLVPEFGAFGGAWASVASYGLMSLVTALQVLGRSDESSLANTN